MTFLKSLKFKNKKAAAFGCYGWSGEGVNILKERLKDAGFDVIDENIKSNWNPMEEDFAKIPSFVTSLIGSSDKKEKRRIWISISALVDMSIESRKGRSGQWCQARNFLGRSARRLDMPCLSFT